MSYDEKRAEEDSEYRRGQFQFHSILRDFGYKVIQKPVRWFRDAFCQEEIARAREEGRRYLGNAVTLRLGLSAVAVPLLAAFVLLWPLFTRFLASVGWAASAAS